MFVHHARTMGTSWSLQIADDNSVELTFSEAATLVAQQFDSIEKRFSTYLPDSEVSRYGRAEISLEDASDDLREVLDLCESVKRASGGSFDIRLAATLGPAADHQHIETAIEPSGVVKGWAIDRAARLLWQLGFSNFCLNVGGDIVASGVPDQSRPGWRVGVRHPRDHENVLAILELRDRCIATSGLYERGAHIAGIEDGALTSLTVVGHDIALVDAYATAAFVKGLDGINWVASMSGFGVLACDEETTYISGEAQHVMVEPKVA